MNVSLLDISKTGVITSCGLFVSVSPGPFWRWGEANFFFKGVTLNPLALLKVWFLILLLVSFFDPHFGYLVDWKLIYKTPPDSSKGVLVSLRGGSSPWICVHTPGVPLTLTVAFLPIPDGNFQLTVLGGLESAEGKTTVLNAGSTQPSGILPYVSAVLFYEVFFLMCESSMMPSKLLLSPNSEGTAITQEAPPARTPLLCPCTTLHSMDLSLKS